MPGLKVFNPGEHVQVTGRVLLDDVHHVVGPKALLKLALGDEESHNAAGEGEKKGKSSPWAGAWPVQWEIKNTQGGEGNWNESQPCKLGGGCSKRRGDGARS